MEVNTVLVVPEVHPKYHSIKSEIVKYSQFNIFFLLSAVSFLLSSPISRSMSLSLVPLILYNLKQMISSASSLATGNILSNISNKLSGLVFLQQLSDFVSKVFFVLYLDFGMPIWLPLFPFALPIALQYHYRKNNCASFQRDMHIIHLILRSAILAALVINAVNDLLDLDMSVTYILLPISILFVLGGSLAFFAMIVMFLMNTYKCIYQEQGSKNLWELFMFWIIFSYSLLLIHFVDTYEDHPPFVSSVIVFAVNGVIISAISLGFSRLIA